jgi:hypothetical protein
MDAASIGKKFSPRRALNDRYDGVVVGVRDLRCTKIVAQSIARVQEAVRSAARAIGVVARLKVEVDPRKRVQDEDLRAEQEVRREFRQLGIDPTPELLAIFHVAGLFGALSWYKERHGKDPPS